MSHIIVLENFGACEEGIQYASKFDSMQSAWDSCTNPSFMLWLLDKLGREKDLHKCACVMARSVLHLYESWYPTDTRVRKCIECKEKWINGKASDEERDAAWAAAGAAAGDAARDAAWAARDAARDAAWAAARDAARDAAWAAAAGAAAGDAARDAAWAARDAARDAAWAAARDAAGDAAGGAQCVLIRSVVPCV